MNNILQFMWENVAKMVKKKSRINVTSFPAKSATCSLPYFLKTERRVEKKNIFRLCNIKLSVLKFFTVSVIVRKESPKSLGSTN